MQNVGTPRFYISWGDYWKSLGASVDREATISPHQTRRIEMTAGQENLAMDTIATAPYKNAPVGIDFIAVLNHNATSDISFAFKQYNSMGDDPSAQEDIPDTLAEYKTVINIEQIQHNGFSIGVFEDAWAEDYSGSTTATTIQAGFKAYPVEEDINFTLDFGCFVFGKTYDMPHSPDLNLKLSYEYDGVKTIQTKGGATLSNALYTKPADWGDMGAWQLGGQANLRSGRRVWDLSFSYLSDSDIMAKVSATSNYGAGDYEVTDPSENTLLDGTDFFSQVINKTMGGHLPFIFQPDKENANPDQFAICRFDMKSFSYDQVANNVYNVKLKIREVW
jgi:hypothetical protein